MANHKLPITEELQFHYLLELMPPLQGQPEYAWLPELFSIIGHERLIMLCKYAGGEIIRIPTLDELQDSIIALEYFYRKNIKQEVVDVPKDLQAMVHQIEEVYHVRDGGSFS